MIKTNLKVVSAVVLSATLAACTTGGKESWKNFESRSVISQVAENDAGLVFFRDNTGSNTEAVNIIINGEYMTSLQPNGFSQIVACGIPQRVGAFVTGTDNQYLRKAGEAALVKPNKGEVSFFRVSVDGNNQAYLTAVDADAARAEIHTNKYQINTLPRLDKASTCTLTYTLDASALFKFDQSAASQILPNGRQDIATIAREMREYSIPVTSIEVIGHTDPQGTPAYNQKLSNARAKTVGQLLVQSGAPASLVKTYGVGETQPVVTGCAANHAGNREALNACNQPNRRVEVKLHTQ